MKTKNNRGYTILEVMISLSLILFIGIFLSNILFTSSKIIKNTLINYELLEQARISMDFMVTQIENSDGLQVIYNENNSFHKLHLNKNSLLTSQRITTFEFDKINNLLKFGGRDIESNIDTVNELSKYIENIELSIDYDLKLLFIKIVMISDINNNKIYKNQITINRVIDVKYKNLK